MDTDTTGADTAVNDEQEVLPDATLKTADLGSAATETKGTPFGFFDDHFGGRQTQPR